MIRYLTGEKEYFQEVKPLWEKLNHHHLSKNPDAKKFYASFTFERRISKLEGKQKIRVVVAQDDLYGENIGYCLSSIHEGEAKIESLYVADAYRKKGIGKTLVQDAVAWMEFHQIEKKTISIAKGNEEAFGFYEKMGFCLRNYVFSKKAKDSGPL